MTNPFSMIMTGSTLLPVGACIGNRADTTMSATATVTGFTGHYVAGDVGKNRGAIVLVRTNLEIWRKGLFHLIAIEQLVMAGRTGRSFCMRATRITVAHATV